MPQVRARRLLTWKRCSRMSHSFLDWALLGYSILRWPRLETICSAVKGRRVWRQRGSLHQALTCSTSRAKSSSSASGSMAGLIMLLLVAMMSGAARHGVSRGAHVRRGDKGQEDLRCWLCVDGREEGEEVILQHMSIGREEGKGKKKRNRNTSPLTKLEEVKEDDGSCGDGQESIAVAMARCRASSAQACDDGPNSKRTMWSRKPKSKRLLDSSPSYTVVTGGPSKLRLSMECPRSTEVRAETCQPMLAARSKGPPPSQTLEIHRTIRQGKSMVHRRYDVD